MITLLQLEYFRRLAATEHITQTAKELYISQTALSSMIIGLERELGIQLFDRSKRSIHLNEAGRIYLKYVNEIFTALENGQAALKDLAQTHEQNISVAFGSSLVWLPLFHAFCKEYPGCSIKQYNWSREGLRKALMDLSIHFVIAGLTDLPNDDLAYTIIKRDSIYLCVAQNHPLANQESVYMSELKEEPFIALPQSSPWQYYCERLFAQAGFHGHTVLECDYVLRAALVESGFGVALTSKSAKEVDLLRPNRYIRIADEYAYRDMALFWNPKKYMSKAATNFKFFCANYWDKDQLA